jgi:2-polyprenyl-3-methyl-5-hydroxy-6-metoxy-1,4-benzoquinol methylase
VDESRKIYGGKGDAPHLGGFTESDLDGVSPALWTFLMKHVNVKSMIDLGCGRGISTKWFLDHGADVLCVEGSQDALDRTVLPKEKIVHHDVYMGPWWPDRTYDMLWSVELLEHIGRHKMDNYLPIMQRSGILFLTASQVSHALLPVHCSAAPVCVRTSTRL